eukprot:GHVU01119450.1.p1 GENE.GHVU01119450.1~~GHVU01119450.1.p1  ORF type:complete len:166 (+),score=17.35 GHVU01119450.1:1037-1534(+)
MGISGVIAGPAAAAAAAAVPPQAARAAAGVPMSLRLPACLSLCRLACRSVCLPVCLYANLGRYSERYSETERYSQVFKSAPGSGYSFVGLAIANRVRDVNVYIRSHARTPALCALAVSLAAMRCIHQLHVKLLFKAKESIVAFEDDKQVEEGAAAAAAAAGGIDK